MIPSLRQPPGLLSFFGVKNGGSFPGYPDTDPFVFTVDLLEWLRGDPTSYETTNVPTTVNAGSAGVSTGVLTVPPGEAWIIQDVSARSSVLAAATTGQLVLSAFYLSNQAFDLFIGEPGPSAPVGGVMLARMSKPPFVLVSGGTLAFMPVFYTGAAGTNLQVEARFNRIKI